MCLPELVAVHKLAHIHGFGLLVFSDLKWIDEVQTLIQGKLEEDGHAKKTLYIYQCR